MKKYIAFYALLTIPFLGYSQYVHKIKADSVLMTNDNCNVELIVENDTRDIKGFLYNKGNGRTEFRKGLLKINDSTYLFGDDTLSTSGSGGGASYKYTNGLTLNNDSLTIGGTLLKKTVVSGNYSFNFKDVNQFAVTGNWDEGTGLDVSGEGVRMFFYPSKGALRAGYVSGDNWNEDSLGYLSFAAGIDTKAIGDWSTSFGYASEATGEGSFSVGDGSLASGYYSLATGVMSRATGDYSIAMGNSAQATQSNSIALGYDARATQTNSVALGQMTRATGQNSLSTGYMTVASGIYATSFNNETFASGARSVAFNHATTASGLCASAFGGASTASGAYSTVFGQGSASQGASSVAFGQGNIAQGMASAVFGMGNNANSSYAFYTGRWADSASVNNGDSWVETDPLFVIGNGTSSDERHNAVTVLKNGNTFINGTGTFSDTLTATTMSDADSSDRVATTAWVKRQNDVLSKIYTRQSAMSNPTGTITMNVDNGYQLPVSITSSGGRTLAFSNLSAGDLIIISFNNSSGSGFTLTLPSNSYLSGTGSAGSVSIPTGYSKLSLTEYDNTSYFFKLEAY